MKVICKFCGEKDEKNLMTRIDDSNFHTEICAQAYLDRKELYETIVRIFKLKAPGPVNYNLINKYVKMGYSYKGMTKALIYCYDIKNNPIAKANNRIGRIPYIYEEAKESYNKKNIEIKKIEETAERISKKEKQFNLVTVAPEPERKNIYKKIEFTNPFDMEEE